MENTEPTVPKKRGRKKKSETIAQENTIQEEKKEEHVPKKRGRKPKGGKLVLKSEQSNSQDKVQPNIILHLKCNLKDINSFDSNNVMINDPLMYNPTIPPNIETYTPNDSNYFNLNENNIQHQLAYFQKSDNDKTQALSDSSVKTENSMHDQEVSFKDINAKLKKLKIQYYKNLDSQYKPACFWCTYEYDNLCCYIPKYEIDDEMFGYGSFCRPECAAAFLMKENIDDSTKFERYHLLNKVYSKVYDYKKNIKPAPDPHYLLEKFYGNLSIQEYRKLLNTEHMLLTIDKPMTRILPELHEDNDNISQVSNVGNDGAKLGIYKVKRQSEKQKGPSKNEIMKENFGF